MEWDVLEGGWGLDVVMMDEVLCVLVIGCYFVGLVSGLCFGWLLVN